VEWATAPINLDSNFGQNISQQLPIEPPTTSAGKAQCKQQMIRDTGAYMSFSMVGLVLVFVLGGLIIILGWTIEPLFKKFRREKSKYKQNTWEAQETLELHKGVYVANGYNPDDGTTTQLPPIIAFANPDTLRQRQQSVNPTQKGAYYTVVQNDYGYNGAATEFPPTGYVYSGGAPGYPAPGYVYNGGAPGHPAPGYVYNGAEVLYPVTGYEYKGEVGEHPVITYK
jgi:hypothetical protein